MPCWPRLYEVVTSVQGVGFVTATNLIINHNEFKYINGPRKLACNAGYAPFEHSFRDKYQGGRNKVSYEANKRLKSLLHMCAASALQAEESSGLFRPKDR
ncbi:MAG: IS110 family transposase [Bacteroidetes bacterium]|nr:IS110 family transposase [Bacteroidota bacterium]